MQTVWHVLKAVVLVLASLYLLICAVLFFAQRSLIYFPQPASNTAVEQVHLRSGDDSLQVSTYSATGRNAVIYFGGNAEDVSQGLPDLIHTFPGRAVYALHYPGYGGSSGKPTQKSIFAAALALFDQVHAEHADVIIVGRSLGSGVAVWAASQRHALGLVLITPFNSLADAAQGQYPFLPVKLLLRDRFDSWKYAPSVTCPTHIIIAARDELIPLASSEALLGRFRNGIATSTVLPDVGHNTVQESPNYWTEVSRGTGSRLP